MRAFEAHHYIMLKDDLEAHFGFNGLQLDAERIARNFANNGNVGRSGFCNDQLLVTAGIMMPWSGCGVAWALLSGDAKHHVHFVHRAVLEGLHYFIDRFQLRRVEANVDLNVEPAVRWVLKLGFKAESIMPNYGPKGEVFAKYVILK